MSQEIEEIRTLSLTARLILCLVNFECFCINSGLQSPIVTELIEYLWKWPLIDGPDEFEPWVSSPPVLIDFALGNDLPTELAVLLNEHSIEEQRFRYIVEGLVEIIWGSFWGASEDLQSFEAFRRSTTATKIAHLPPVTPFKFSLFKDNGGWGLKPSTKDYEYWKSLRPNA